MNITINSDSSISTSVEQIERITSLVSDELRRFDEQITRIEVHLSDESKRKSGTDDKRCLMEARLSGLQPIAVSHQAGSVHQACEGATEKLKRALDNATERRRDRTEHKA